MKIEQLWAPWRMEYIKSKKAPGCIFCSGIKEDEDKENLILYRGRYSSVILNRFPYNNGHVMVFPYKHTGDITSLDDEEALDLFSTLRKSIEVLKKRMSPMGFNIGMNLGRCAGAGIEDHIHIHIVPRWEGDTNYMPVIGATKVISEHLLSTYDELLPLFDREKRK